MDHTVDIVFSIFYFKSCLGVLGLVWPLDQSSWVRRQYQTQEPPDPRLLGLTWLPDPIQIQFSLI